jgi:golgin subfamily B member 1
MADFQDYLAILDAEPNNDQALEALERIAGSGDGTGLLRALDDARKTHRERGDLELVVRLYDVEIAAAADAARKADLLLEKGRFLVEELGSEESAVECFKNVLQLRPDDEEAQDSLAQIDLVRNNWQRIVKKYIDEARVQTDRQLTTSLYLDAADVLARYNPGNPDIEAYLRRALDIEPRNRRAATHLERLLRREGRWEELATLLSSRVENAAAKDERIGALIGLADLAKARLGRPQLVLECMKKILAIEPAHPRALKILIEAYSSEENWIALVKLYEGALRTRRVATPESELAMVLQIAMIYWRRLNQLDAAEEFFRRVRKLDPTHAAMIEFYRAYHGERGEGQKLLQILQQAHKGEADPQKRGALGVEIASLAEGSVGNPEKAIDLWKAILRQNPRNDEARGALKRLYQKTEKWNALLELLKEEIEAISPADQAGKEARVARLVDVAAIYRDRLNLDVMVINTFNNVLALIPDHPHALDALAQKYEQLARWNDLINVLQRKADALSGSPEGRDDRIQLLRRIASLWADRFGNHAQAIRPLEDLIALVPDDREAVTKLKEIYAKRRQWRALLDLMGREASALAGQEKRVHLAEMARIAADRLGDNRAAIAIWNRALEDDPQDPDALMALVGLYEREKRWLALAEIYQRQRNFIGNVDDKVAPHVVSILDKLGTVYLERIEAPQLAAEVFREILKIQPGHSRAVRLLREILAQSGDFGALEDLYGALGDWDGLLEVLHAAADRTPEPHQKLAILERIATLAVEKAAPEKAAKAYERILALDPQNLTAARALVPIYRRTEKWARLLSTYEALLAHAESPGERLTLHLDIRQLCEEKLGSKALAFQWCARAYELAPDDPRLLKDLERLGAEADAWEQVAEILERRVASLAVSQDEKVRLLREIGRIRAVRLHKPDEARQAWEHVLGLLPDDVEAMAALEEIATQQGRWGDLLVIYHRRADLEEDAPKKLDMLFKIAFIEEERVGDLDAAARTYEKILGVQPRSARALRALAKVQGSRGDAAGLARALELELDSTNEPDQRVGVYIRLGSLYEEKLGKRRQALDCYEEALKLQPSNRTIHGALERFLTPGSEDRVEVATLMAPIYERIDEPARLANALDAIRGAEPDARARLALDRRLVSLYLRKLGDPLNAYEAATRVLQATPEDGDNRRDLMVLAGELSAFDDLAVQLEKALAQRTTESTGLDLRVLHEISTELALLYDDKLSKMAEADIAWRRVLDLDSTDDRAYDALERLLRAQERWDDLRALLLRRETNTLDGNKRKQILLQICDLHEGVLEDAAGAMESYRRVLDLDPSLLRAYKALERLYEADAKWADLEDLIARESQHVRDPNEATHLLYRRAELRAARLEDPVGALDLAEEVISRAPDHPGARALLEGLFPNASLKLRIARILGPRYEADGRWSDLVRVLSGELEFAQTSIERLDLLARIAGILEERLGDETLAFDTWAEAILAEADDRRSREALERLARRTGRWAETAAVWEKAIDAIADSELSLRATLLAEVAAIYDRCLADPARAIDAYRRLLEVDLSNVQISRPAAEALERLYAGRQEWGSLIDILRRQTEWSDAAAARTERLYRIASIQEENLNDVEAAVATWRDVLADDLEDARALDALERLYTARGEWRDLVEIIRRRVELQADVQSKKMLLTKVAHLHEKELGDASEATLAYLEVLDFLPDDVTTLGELARLYRHQERWSDLLDIDERRLSLATQPAAKTILTWSIADNLHRRLHRTEEAIQRYRQILAAHPEAVRMREGPGSNDEPHLIAACKALAAVEKLLEDEGLRLQAAEILLPLYVAAGEWQKVVDLYELEARSLDDARERIGRYRKIAEIQERSLGDLDAAFEAWARACRDGLAEPDLADLLAAVQRLAIDRDRVPDLIELYRDLAPDVLDAELQRRMYLDIGDLARGKLRDTDLAKEYYRRVLDAHPDDTRALQALELLYRETQEAEPLLDVLRRKADRADDDDVRRDALLEIAILCEEKLGREEEAFSAWEQVLEISPADADASKALERLYAQKERWVELAELLERRLGFTDDVNEAIGIRYRLGELYEKHMTDPDRAVENYQAVLSADPQNQAAVAALERFLEDVAMRSAVAAVLEPLYVGRHEWPKLIKITEIRLDAETDPSVRRAITRRIARLHEDQLEDLEGAFRWYGKVFREDPDERAVRDQLVRLASVLERWDGLAHIYQGFLDDEPDDGSATREVARMLAEIYDRRIGDVERARACYRRVLQLEPDDLESFQRLEAMLVRAERWFALIESYEEAIEATLDVGRKKDLLARTARIQEQRLTAPDQAIDANRSILDLDPDDTGALAELERLYQEQKRWHDLSDLFITRIERAVTPEEGVAFRFRLAEVLEQRLQESRQAIDEYEQIVAVDAAHAGAIAALERLVMVDEHRERIIGILEPLYRKHDWWQKLVVVLDASLAFVDDKAQRVTILREMASLHEERGLAKELALKALERAWKEDVADEDVYLEFSRLAEKLGKWDILISALDSGAEGQYDYDLAARLLGRIGQIEDEQRKNKPRAIAAWKRVLEVKEDDGGALDALENLYISERQFEPLVKVLERKLELSNDVTERKELLYRIAELTENALGRRDAAISSWKQLLDLDDEDAAALDALDRLYREAKDHRSLVEVLFRKIELADDAKERRVLRLATADVYEKELGDHFEAIAQHKAVLDDFPEDLVALEALDGLYAREKSWNDLVEILDRRAALQSDRAVRAELEYRAARVIEVEEVEPEQAIDRYRKTLEHHPSHQPTRDALDALSRRDDTLFDAAAALEPIYRMEQNFPKLAELLERRLGAGGDRDQRRTDFASLAEVHEVGQKDPLAAFAAWARWLKEAPDDADAQGELERLTEARGAWKELTDLYADILGGLMDAELARAYALKVAEVQEQSLANLDAAATFYRKALEQGGDEVTPLAALDRLLERQGKWQDLAEVLEREAQAAMSDEGQAGFLFRLGTVREERLADPALAVAAYRDVLDRQAQHPGARAALERLLASESERAQVIAILEPLYEQESDFTRLLALMEAKLTVETAPSERALLLQQIAELAEDKLGDHDRALDAAGRWLEEEPSAEDAAAELERLAGNLNRWEDVAARLKKVLEQEALDPDVQKELATRLGRVLLEEIDDPSRAEHAWRWVLSLDPHNARALLALDKIARATHDPTALAEILGKRAEAELDVGAKRNLWAELASLAEERLSDDARAIAAWRHVVEVDEGDQEAHGRLAALYERGGRWEDLLEILDLAARYVDKEAEKGLRRKIAWILTQQLNDLDRAVEAWTNLLDLGSDDENVIDTLTEVHRRRKDWLAVVEMLGRRLSLAEQPSDKVAILAQLAQVSEVDRGSPDEAVGYLHQILDVDPGYRGAYEALDRLLNAQERWHDLIEVLKRHAEVRGTLGDPDGETELLARAADVWQEKLDNPEAASEILEEVSRRQPRNVMVLNRLAKIYDAAGDLDRSSEVLQRALALGPKGRDAADLHYRLGKLTAAQTGDTRQAMQHYQRSLAFDGTHGEAMAAVEQEARERQAWPEVAEILERRAATEKDRGKQARLCLELADLFREHFGQPAEALRFVEHAAQVMADDVAVQERLADLLFAAGRGAEAEPIYRNLSDKARAARKMKEVARYQQRLGALRESAGDLGEALKSYEEAYKVDPTHPQTMAGLGRIYFAHSDWEKARRIYRSMLLQTLDPSVGVTKADVYLQLGLIHAHLGETPKARSMYERGLELEPDHSGLRQAMAQVAKS